MGRLALVLVAFFAVEGLAVALFFKGRGSSLSSGFLLTGFVIVNSDEGALLVALARGLERGAAMTLSRASDLRSLVMRAFLEASPGSTALRSVAL